MTVEPRRSLSRLPGLPGLVGLVGLVLLAGCGSSSKKDLGELLGAFFMLVLVVGAVVLLVALAVAVLNFVRPKTWSMVLGFLLGVLSALGALASLAALFTAGVPGQAAIGIAVHGTLAIVLVASAFRARKTLSRKA